MIEKYNIGIAVMRCQPFHSGHKVLLDKMISECNNPILFLGSVQEARTSNNPLTYIERLEILRKFYPKDKLQIAPVQDIGNPDRWATYILTLTQAHIGHLNGSVCYYGGSPEDVSYFEKMWLDTQTIERNDLSATWIRDMIRKDVLELEPMDELFESYRNDFIEEIIRGT